MFRKKLVRFVCSSLILSIAILLLHACQNRWLSIEQMPAQTQAGQRISCSQGIPRDKHQQPFSCDSIWNVPIGDRAHYQPIQLQPAQHWFVDEEYYIVTTASDPVVDWHDPGNWGMGRCEIKQAAVRSLRVPDSLIVPDARPNWTPNNPAAFLQPDGQTLIQLNPLSRCEAGGAVFGYTTPGYPEQNENIYGSGITGGHGGSGLSSIGGSIRLGELARSEPIAHALKLVLYGHENLYHQPPGFRWPAVRADAYAFDRSNPAHYGGQDPALVMGTLLAIPPAVSAADLRLDSTVGKQLFQALQDYGAYVVDDSAWDAVGICAEKGVWEELQHMAGDTIGNQSAIDADLNRILPMLQAVTNSSLAQVGGGGQPRRPYATPIGN